MGLLKKIEIKNFMCFREEVSFDLSRASYLIGANNSGKTAVLTAIRCFFDDKLFTDEFLLNKTEFLGKGPAFNKSVISVYFDLDKIQTKMLKQRLIKNYGNVLKVTKYFIFRKLSKMIVIDYEIKNIKSSLDELPEDIKTLLGSLHITHLHPQEGKYLQVNAQKKLKDRLLLNWGRKGTITKSLEAFKHSWDDLRKAANIYLSKTLTESLQDVWPGSVTKINLPKNIEDIIAISDIAFQGNKTMPDIPLNAQGTGAQSLVLYYVHYLLDSDRSLHKGEYHPLWLLEEPESFLHVNLIFTLGQQLNSQQWLRNIQMIISTHSPIILSTSRLGNELVFWNLLSSHKKEKGKWLKEWSEEEIKEIGNRMGDSNFYIYFLTASNNNLIFIEDTKLTTLEAWRNSKIEVTKGLGGISEIVKYISVLIDSSNVLARKCFFIIDADNAEREISRFIKDNPIEENRFRKYRISEKVFLILLPKGFITEDLFEEFDNHLEECVNSLYEDVQQRKIAQKIPTNLSGICTKLRHKSELKDKNDIKQFIKNEEDVKSLFWQKASKGKYTIADRYKTSLKKLVT